MRRHVRHRVEAFREQDDLFAVTTVTTAAIVTVGPVVAAAYAIFSHESAAAAAASVGSAAAEAAGAAILAFLALGYLRRHPRARLAGLPKRPPAREALVRGLAGLAGVLAGRRRAHLREAWAADLYGDPASGGMPSWWRRTRFAAGFIVAALRCRLDDASALAWRPVDALLASWHGSKLTVVLPATAAAGLILANEGFYGLITNAENLAVIAGAPWAAIKFLRKYRQIPAPKRAERKVTDGHDESRTSMKA